MLVSNGVAELCLGKGMKFAEMRKRAELKGFDEPVSTRQVVIDLLTLPFGLP